MSTITLFSGSYCNDQEISRLLVEHTGYRLIRDEEVVSAASAISGLAAGKIARAFSGKPLVFNSFTHEKERSIAYLKLAMAELLPAENLIIAGFVSHLIPKKISHVLRVCLIADLKFRMAAAQQQGVPAKEAAKTHPQAGRGRCHLGETRSVMSTTHGQPPSTTSSSLWIKHHRPIPRPLS